MGNLLPHISRFVAIGAVVCLVAACGGRLGGRGTANGSIYGDGSSGSTKKGKGTGSQYAGGNGNVASPGYSAALQKCDQWVNIADTVVTECGAVFQSNVDEMSRACWNAFQKLYNWECNSVESNVRGAATACKTDIGENWSYLPSDCQQALRQFMK